MQRRTSAVLVLTCLVQLPVHGCKAEHPDGCWGAPNNSVHGVLDGYWIVRDDASPLWCVRYTGPFRPEGRELLGSRCWEPERLTAEECRAALHSQE